MNRGGRRSGKGGQREHSKECAEQTHSGDIVSEVHAFQRWLLSIGLAGHTWQVSHTVLAL